MTTMVLSKVNSIELPEVNWRTICVAGFFIVVVLLGFYAWQINDLTKKSYLAVDYDRQITKLSEESKNLEISFAKNSFLEQAFAKIKALNFQKTQLVKYVRIVDNSVAAVSSAIK